jgi:hypothetical protein
MKALLTALMLCNVALFVFGALQHAGVTIGSLHEPTIIPASVVEALCAVALSCGAAAVTKHSLNAWRAACTGNLVAIVGVVIGMVALAMGAGPADRKQRPLPQNHAGVGDGLAPDPPCSRGTHGAKAELNRSLAT